VSVIGDLLGDLLAGVAGDALTHGAKQPHFAEGPVNASLGALAAFAGTLGFVFSLMALLSATFKESYLDMGAAIVVGFGLFSWGACYGALRAGRKAPSVTARHLGLAKFGIVVAVPGLIVASVALTLTIIRLVQW